MNNMKISLIALSTLLTACGGGGSSVPVTSLPNAVKISTIKTSVDNMKDVVNFVESKGIEIDVNNGVIRSATSKRRNTNTTNDISIIEKKYNIIKGMLDQIKDDINSLTDQLKDFICKITDKSLDELNSVTPDILGNLKDKLTVKNLEDINFDTVIVDEQSAEKSGGYLKFKLDDNNKIKGAIFVSAEVEDDNTGEGVKIDYKDFKRKDNQIVASNFEENKIGHAYMVGDELIAEDSEDKMIAELIDEKFKTNFDCNENCYYIRDDVWQTEKPEDLEQGGWGVYDNNNGQIDAAIAEMKKDSLYKNGLKYNQYSELVLMGGAVELSYSEFGYHLFELKDFEKGLLPDFIDAVEVFKGGYDNKLINKASIDEKIKFKGRAVGYVKAGDSFDNVDFLNGTLDLTFNPENKSEKLEFKFDNFYDFTVSKNEDIASPTVEWTDKKCVTKYKISDFESVPFELDTLYYGEIDKPREVVGSFAGNAGEDDDKRELAISFGAKK